MVCGDLCAFPSIQRSIAMISLHRVFDNWFSSRKITPRRKLAFAEDTRARLAANNGGGHFDILLPQLNAAIAAAGGANSSEMVALAVRKAAVQGKRALMETIKDTVSRREGRIRDVFGREGAVYAEFFPEGVSGYRQMREGEVAERLRVFIAAAERHLPELAGEFIALRADWVTVRAAASTRIAAASAADGDQDAALVALDVVLMKVVFTAGLAFTCERGMGPVLFDESILRP